MTDGTGALTCPLLVLLARCFSCAREIDWGSLSQKPLLDERCPCTEAVLTFWYTTRKSVHFIAITLVALSIGCGGVVSPAPQNPGKSQVVLASGVLDFGNVPVGTSTSQSVVITNQGNASATVSQINISGSGFRMTSQTLPLSLASGQSMTVTTQFAPSSAGSASG